MSYPLAYVSYVYKCVWVWYTYVYCECKGERHFTGLPKSLYGLPKPHKDSPQARTLLIVRMHFFFSFALFDVFCSFLLLRFFRKCVRCSPMQWRWRGHRVTRAGSQRVIRLDHRSPILLYILRNITESPHSRSLPAIEQYLLACLHICIDITMSYTRVKVSAKIQFAR